jgi:peptide/nickel transport system substrate-binding protein
VFWNKSASTALEQIEVRKALSAAVDTTELTSAVLGGYGKPATDPFSPLLGPLGATSTQSSTSSDPRSVLERNGWVAADDGVYAKKIGKASVRLEFTLTVPDVPFLVHTADILKEHWSAIGANVKVETMSLDELLTGAIKNRTYEALLFGNTLTRSGDSYSFWHSSQRLYPGLNLALYQNPSVDRLIEKIRSENDPAKRESEMGDLRTTIMKDGPALFLFSPQSTYVTTKNLRGIEPLPITDPSERFEHVSAWYVATKRVRK